LLPIRKKNHMYPNLANILAHLPFTVYWVLLSFYIHFAFEDLVSTNSHVRQIKLNELKIWLVIQDTAVGKIMARVFRDSRKFIHVDLSSDLMIYASIAVICLPTMCPKLFGRKNP
jgi:hypothetical protein